MNVKSLVALVLGLFIFSSCNSSDDSEKTLQQQEKSKRISFLMPDLIPIGFIFHFQKMKF